MKKTRNTVLAGILVATAMFTACGCQSQGVTTDDLGVSTNSIDTKPTGLVSESIITDFEYIGKIEALANAEVSLSFAVSDGVSIDAKLTAKGTEKLVQVDVPKLKFEMPAYTEGEEPTVMELSDVSVIVDTENAQIYVLEKSLMGIMGMTGEMPEAALSFDHEAEWVELSLEDTEDMSISLGMPDMSKLKGMLNSTMLPEITDAFKPVEDKFFINNKHGIQIGNENIPVLIDTLLTMCEDGSIEAILKSANEAGLIKPGVDYKYDEETEDFIEIEKPIDLVQMLADFKADLETAKEEFAESKSEGTIKVVTGIAGEEGKLTADITLTANVKSVYEATEWSEAGEEITKCTLDCKLTEGTPEIVVPTSTVSMEDWMTAFQEAVMGSTGDGSTATDDAFND